LYAEENAIVIRVGVYGATGYTGIELLRILKRHPQAEVSFATSRSHAGASIRDVVPVPWDLLLMSDAEVDPAAVDVVFCCLPAGSAATQVALVMQTPATKAIDLSADFRLKDVAIYQKWYKLDHPAVDLVERAEYGLPEIYRERIRGSRLIANPGCYPTSVLIGLFPLLQRGLAADAPIIVDSKSGVSGAGRGLNLRAHFVEANENLTPYGIGRSHRHWPEIEQEIVASGGPSNQLIFSPHLLPVSRGILSTIYVTLNTDVDSDSLNKLYQEIYANEPFVWVLPYGQMATLAHTVNTNRCAVSISLVSPRQAIMVASIDNLIKGAAGQAVQNMNLMFGLDESAGLVV
jgi:N-acetyl-gamma-glutamyl-phosphate reductase